MRSCLQFIRLTQSAIKWQCLIKDGNCGWLGLHWWRFKYKLFTKWPTRMSYLAIGRAARQSDSTGKWRKYGQTWWLGDKCSARIAVSKAMACIWTEWHVATVEVHLQMSDRSICRLVQQGTSRKITASVIVICYIHLAAQLTLVLSVAQSMGLAWSVGICMK